MLATDFLQSMINQAKDTGLLKLPILTAITNDFLVIQYADNNGRGLQTAFLSEISVEQVLPLNRAQSGLQ